VYLAIAQNFPFSAAARMGVGNANYLPDKKEGNCIVNTAYAFFDVDGTLIHGKSMFGFHDFWYQSWIGFSTKSYFEEYEDATAILRILQNSDSPRDVVNRRFYEMFAGRDVAEVTRCAQAWSQRELAKPSFLIHEIVVELESLRAKGIEPVFVSGSFMEVLRPIAQHSNVSHILATQLLHDGKRYSGRFKSPQTIGTGKAIAVRDFARERGVQLQECWAYGDDVSDVDMLETVGNAVAVIGDSELEAIAKQRSWQCRHISNPSAKTIHQNSSNLP